MKKKNSPRLTLQREIGRKHIFIIVSVYMWGSQGRKVRNGKLGNGRAIFQKRLASFTVLKVHCHTQTFQDDFHFLCLFFSGILLPPHDSDQRLCLYLPLLCTTSLYWTPYLISVSTGGSFALSYSSISGPAGSAESPHQEDLIITIIVFTQSLCLRLPRTWPHLNHYLSHTQ